MKKHTKLLVILLSVALVCTGLVMAVSADGSNGQASYTDLAGGTVTENLAEALANVPAGGTVTLKGDCTISTKFNVTKDLTIDLGGYKLTSTTSIPFYVGAENVTFSIVGKGSMDLNGEIVQSGNFAGITLNVIGDSGTEGIHINHHGHSSDSRLVDFTNNTVLNVENVDVYSDAKLINSSKSFFHIVTASANGPKINLNNFNLVETYGNIGWQMYALVNLTGTSHFTMSNSTVYGGNALLDISGANNSGKEVAKITDCTIVNIDTERAAGRGSLINNDSSASKGIINIYDSLLVSEGRLLAAERTSHNIRVNGYGSTFKTVKSEVDYGTSNPSAITRKIDLYLYPSDKGESKIIAMEADICQNSQSNGYNIYAPKAGVRTNRLSVVNGTDQYTSIKVPASFNADGSVASWTFGATSSTDNYAWIYDPAGDAEAPYVLVDTSVTDIANPDFYKNYSFDNILFTTKTSAGRDLFVKNDNTAKWSSEEVFYLYNRSDKWITGGQQWDIKAGTLTYVQNPESSYVRYWIPDNDGLDYTTTTNLGTDPYLIMGLGPHGQFAENGNVHLSALKGDNRKKVMVAEIDFGTDSEYGYPSFGVIPQARDHSNDPTAANIGFNVANDGTIANGLSDAQNVKLNPAGMWNRLSAVCISDPANTQGLVYFYLNGEYMGNCVLFSEGNVGKTYNYFQGMRFNIAKDQTVGSALCIDNVSFRCYTDYQFEGETDYVAATETSEEVEAVYYPERYIQGTPAHVYMSTSFEHSWANDIPTALANATANGAHLELKADITAPQLIKTNGVVSTNGYIFNVDPASYGCTVSYDANGNAVYTFNESIDNSCYEGTVKYHFYVGADHANHADNAYETLEFTAGQIATYAKNQFNGIFSNNGKNLSVQYQLGWNNPLVVTPELLDKGEDVYVYPTFSNDSRVVTNGYVKNSIGRIIKLQFTDAEAVNAYMGIKNGETLVLLANMTVRANGVFYSNSQTTTVDGVNYVNGVRIDNEYTAEELAKMKEIAQVIGVDLNGYSIHSSNSIRIAMVGRNTVMNVYSSNPGSVISSWRIADEGNRVWGQRMLTIMHDTGVESNANSKATYNAYLNIGKFGDIPGSNLSLVGAVLFEGNTGDSSCEITVDGIYGARTIPESGGAVMTRHYDGDIIVKNSLIAAPTSVAIVDMKSYANLDYKPYVLFENCILINKGGASNITDNNGAGEGTHLEFINCTSNGRLNPATGNRSLFGYGNAAAYLPPVSGWYNEDNLTRAYYNQPMTMDGFLEEGVNYIKFKIPTFVAATTDESGNSVSAHIDESKYIYIANYGCGSDVSGASDAKSTLVLPILTEKLVYKDEVVKVTWKKADGTTVTQDYVKGANVLAQQMSGDRKAINPISAGTSATLNSLKVDVTGWPELPTNIQEATTINAIYTVTPLLAKDSIKTNLTLTSDFTINLYIPAAFNEYITVKNGETVLDKTVVNIGTEETPENYVKVAIAKACNKATENAVFTIVLKEGAYTATVTSTMSIIDYADAILTTVDAEGKAVYSDESKALMYYMLGYAKEAVKYFDGAESANVAVIDSVIAKYNGGKATVDTTYENAVNAGLTGALKNATVTLTSTPAFVFTLMDNFVGTVTITDGVNTKTYTFEEGNEATTITHEVKVYNFTQTLTITVVGKATVDEVTGTEINAEGQYNFASFGAYHKEKAADTSFEKAADSAACEDIIKALYEYAEVANWYKNETLAEKLAAVAE